VIAHGGFNLHFPVVGDVKHLFTHLLAMSVFSLSQDMSVQVLCFKIGLFVFLLLSCVSSLYILDINPLSDMCLFSSNP
jgi:hypothetical protein